MRSTSWCPSGMTGRPTSGRNRRRNFKALAVTKRLAGGCVTEFDVPAATPWVLLVIAPDSAARAEIWPPSIMADDASLCAVKLTPRLGNGRQRGL